MIFRVCDTHTVHFKIQSDCAADCMAERGGILYYIIIAPLLADLTKQSCPREALHDHALAKSPVICRRDFWWLSIIRIRPVVGVVRRILYENLKAEESVQSQDKYA